MAFQPPSKKKPAFSVPKRQEDGSGDSLKVVGAAPPLVKKKDSTSSTKQKTAAKSFLKPANIVPTVEDRKSDGKVKGKPRKNKNEENKGEIGEDTKKIKKKKGDKTKKLQCDDSAEKNKVKRKKTKRDERKATDDDFVDDQENKPTKEDDFDEMLKEFDEQEARLNASAHDSDEEEDIADEDGVVLDIDLESLPESIRNEVLKEASEFAASLKSSQHGEFEVSSKIKKKRSKDDGEKPKKKRKKSKSESNDNEVFSPLQQEQQVEENTEKKKKKRKKKKPETADQCDVFAPLESQEEALEEPDEVPKKKKKRKNREPKKVTEESEVYEEMMETESVLAMEAEPCEAVEADPYEALEPQSVHCAQNSPDEDLEEQGNEADGTWVQCDNRWCRKWRLLQDVHDPTELPQKWTCDFNTNDEYNSCDKPEQTWSKEEEENFVYTEYSEGSIVWAKMAGFPWWPAMVQNDPDIRMFYEPDELDPMIPVYYHVVFLDKKPTRAWVRKMSIKPFCCSKEEELLAFPYMAKGQSFKKKRDYALQQAIAAAGMTLEEKLSKYKFKKSKCAVLTEEDSQMSMSDSEDDGIPRKFKKRMHRPKKSSNKSHGEEGVSVDSVTIDKSRKHDVKVRLKKKDKSVERKAKKVDKEGKAKKKTRNDAEKTAKTFKSPKTNPSLKPKSKSEKVKSDLDCHDKVARVIDGETGHPSVVNRSGIDVNNNEIENNSVEGKTQEYEMEVPPKGLSESEHGGGEREGLSVTNYQGEKSVLEVNRAGGCEFSKAEKDNVEVKYVAESEENAAGEIQVEKNAEDGKKKVKRKKSEDGKEGSKSEVDKKGGNRKKREEGESGKKKKKSESNEGESGQKKKNVKKEKSEGEPRKKKTIKEDKIGKKKKSGEGEPDRKKVGEKKNGECGKDKKKGGKKKRSEEGKGESKGESGERKNAVEETEILENNEDDGEIGDSEEYREKKVEMVEENVEKTDEDDEESEEDEREEVEEEENEEGKGEGIEEENGKKEDKMENIEGENGRSEEDKREKIEEEESEEGKGDNVEEENEESEEDEMEEVEEEENEEGKGEPEDKLVQIHVEENKQEMAEESADEDRDEEVHGKNEEMKEDGEKIEESERGKKKKSQGKKMKTEKGKLEGKRKKTVEGKCKRKKVKGGDESKDEERVAGVEAKVNSQDSGEDFVNAKQKELKPKKKKVCDEEGCGKKLKKKKLTKETADGESSGLKNVKGVESLAAKKQVKRKKQVDKDCGSKKKKVAKTTGNEVSEDGHRSEKEKKSDEKSSKPAVASKKVPVKKSWFVAPLAKSKQSKGESGRKQKVAQKTTASCDRKKESDSQTESQGLELDLAVSEPKENLKVPCNTPNNPQSSEDSMDEVQSLRLNLKPRSPELDVCSSPKLDSAGKEPSGPVVEADGKVPSSPAMETVEEPASPAVEAPASARGELMKEPYSPSVEMLDTPSAAPVDCSQDHSDPDQHFEEASNPDQDFEEPSSPDMDLADADAYMEFDDKGPDSPAMELGSPAMSVDDELSQSLDFDVGSEAKVLEDEQPVVEHLNEV